MRAPIVFSRLPEGQTWWCTANIPIGSQAHATVRASFGVDQYFRLFPLTLRPLGGNCEDILGSADEGNTYAEGAAFSPACQQQQQRPLSDTISDTICPREAQHLHLLQTETSKLRTWVCSHFLILTVQVLHITSSCEMRHISLILSSSSLPHD